MITILIPIIFLTFFILYPNELVIFCNTILGKLTLLVTIVYYTSVDMLYGVFTSLLVIAFYQLNMYETMTLMDMAKDSSIDEKTEFRNQYCQNGDVIFKHTILHPEITEHIFPEITFHGDNHCNVCESNCSFSLTKSPNTKSEVGLW